MNGEVKSNWRKQIFTFQEFRRWKLQLLFKAYIQRRVHIYFRVPLCSYLQFVFFFSSRSHHYTRAPLNVLDIFFSCSQYISEKEFLFMCLCGGTHGPKWMAFALQLLHESWATGREGRSTPRVLTQRRRRLIKRPRPREKEASATSKLFPPRFLSRRLCETRLLA